VRDILSHIFGEAHADGESDKLIASVTKQATSQHHESTCMPSLRDKPRYNRTWVPQNAMLNKTVQFNTTDDDATTPSSTITTSVHDTSTAGTPTPTDPDLDE
jgi:hypothetical protein